MSWQTGAVSDDRLDPTPESAEPEGFVTELSDLTAQNDNEPSLWRNRPYVALLTGETVAAVGVEIAQVAIPIIAVSYLVATEFQVGLLGTAEGIAFLRAVAAGGRVGGSRVAAPRDDRRESRARRRDGASADSVVLRTCSTSRSCSRSRS